MNIFTPKSNDQLNTGRRSFICKAGAAVSAALATAVPAMSMPIGKLENLEDENQIRRLHHI